MLTTTASASSTTTPCTVKIGEKTYLLDFTVKSFSQDVIAESQLTVVGAAAEKAEKSKIAAIEKKYIV